MQIIISVSGAIYQLKDGTTGQLLYESADPTEVANYAIANVPVGSSILFSAGTCSLQGSIIGKQKDGVTLLFAMIFVANGMSASAIILNNVNNWLIQGVTIDGNANNQLLDDNHRDNGIDIESSATNFRVNGAYIYNVRRFGFAISDDSAYCGIANSKITNCGWNAINLAGQSPYAINNEVAYCSDVGITSYGYNAIIKNNYVHDMNGTTGWGPSDPCGIGVEGGGNNTITGNTLLNCPTGMAIYHGGNTISLNNIRYSLNCGIGILSDYNIVSDNEIVDWDTQDTWKNAITIHHGGSHNRLFGNKLTSTHPYAQGIVVGEAGGGTNNQIGDATQPPNIITLASIGNNSAIIVCAGAVGTIIENNKIIGGAGPAGIHVRAGAIGTIIRHNDLSQCTNDQKILDEGTGTLYGCPTCDLTFPSQEELAAHIVSAHPAPTPSASVAARVPCFGNKALVQVYLRKLRDKIFSRKQHEKLHPLI